MAGNPIASLVALLGFKYQKGPLRQFKQDLQNTSKQINTMGKQADKEATRTTKSVKRTAKGSSEALQHVFSNFSKKSKPKMEEVRNSWGRLKRDMARPLTEDEQKLFLQAQDRIVNRANDIRKEQQKIRKRQRAERLRDEKALQDALYKMDKEAAAAEAKKAQKSKAHWKQASQDTKKHKQHLEEVRKKIFGIEKAYDKHRAQLKQVRMDYKFIQDQWRSGNITLEQRERHLNTLIAKYRQLQAAQSGASGAGPFAGGKDPRQKGTHNVISAIHSDVGLGVMAGGFALAQSSRAFQGVIAMEQGLAAATGSFEKGAAEMEYLIELSQKLGLFVGDLGEDYAKFAASARDTNLTAKDQREVFKGVAAQVKILNLSAADSKRIFRALSQMMSSGQIMAQELKLQMGDQLPGAMRAMARAAHNLGITQDDSIASMNKAMEAGLLLSEEVLPEFSKELWEAANQGGALEEAMKTTNAAFGRFQTNVWLANKTFQEAGMDKGIRDLTNTTSDFIRRADEIWTVLGKAGPALFVPFRALFELLGSLSDRMGILGDGAQGNGQKIKTLGLIVSSLFRWSRKLLATFLLIPAAMSGVSKLIDGEMLTWQEWALTLAGIAASLPIILKAMRGIKNLGGVAGQLKGASGKVSETAQRSARDATRPQTSRLAADWTQGRSSIWQRIGESAKRGASRGTANFLPIGAGSVMSEEEFVKRQQDVPWWDLIGRLEQKQQEMNQQAVISGDVTFNINGDNSQEIADEVLRVIHQDVLRPTSLNEVSQEK